MAKRRTNKEVIESKTVKDQINEIITKRLRFKALNESQKDFSRLILDNQITVGYGPAGTGKSYVSIFKALELIQLKSNNYNRIIIIKPIIEAEENLGYLPGTVKEKLEPYTQSSIDLIDKVIGKKKRIELEELEIVDTQALAFLRGRNIDNTILVMEESQNMSKGQMKTLLTRIGEDSKFIISGDLDQSDRFKDVTKSGLYDATVKLKNLDDIGLHEFHIRDIVRNPLIGKILERYVDKVFKPQAKLLVENEIKGSKLPKQVAGSSKKKKVKKEGFSKYFKW